MDTIRKIQESIVIENFRDVFPEFPAGRLIKSESPDFILKTGRKHSKGIELTALPSSSYIISKETISTFITDVQNSISKKEEKFKIYRKKMADEYWLIIFSDAIIAQGINFNNHIGKLIFSNGFDRIFIFGLFEKKFREIASRTKSVRK
jgi:hypothetical protein